MSSIPKKTTTTSTTDLPVWAQPYAQAYLGQVYDYYMPGGQMVPGQAPGDPSRYEGGTLRTYDGPDRTILGFNDQELQAQNAQAQYLGSGPVPGMNETNQYALDVLSGKYLTPDSNPYVKQLYDTAARSVTNNYQDSIAPQQAANAAFAGAFGGSAQANEQVRSRYGLGQNLSDLATQVYGGNYAAERQRQSEMAQFMPQLGQYNENLWLNRLDRQNALGANRRQLEQAQTDVGYENAMTRYEYPMKVLQWLGQGLGAGATGSSSTQTAPNPNASNAAATYGGLGIAGAGTLINGYKAWNSPTGTTGQF